MPKAVSRTAWHWHPLDLQQERKLSAIRRPKLAKGVSRNQEGQMAGGRAFKEAPAKRQQSVANHRAQGVRQPISNQVGVRVPKSTLRSNVGVSM